MPRIGIAGFGFMGQFHFNAYRGIPGARVAALFDSDPGVFERGATKGNLGEVDLGNMEGVARVSDFDSFLAQDLDVIDLCVPTIHHRELAEKALQSGRAVLVEKPMALTTAACDAIIDAAGKAGKLLMVGQCVRFWPGYDRILAAARERTYGRLITATLRRIGGAPVWSNWFLDAKKSGGGIMDVLVHDFDFVRAAIGMPAAIQARGCCDVIKPGSGVGYCRADLHFPDGPSSVTIEGGWVVGPEFPFSMTAFFQFENATMAFGIDPEAPLAIYHRDGKKETPELSKEQGYLFELRYFLECLEQGKAPEICPPGESRDAIAMAVAARQSVLTGEPIKLDAGSSPSD